MIKNKVTAFMLKENKGMTLFPICLPIKCMMILKKRKRKNRPSIRDSFYAIYQ